MNSRLVRSNTLRTVAVSSLFVVLSVFTSLMAEENVRDARSAKLADSAERQIADKVVPALQSGDQTDLLKALKTITSNLNPVRLKTVNEVLSQNEMPSVAAMMVEAYLTAMVSDDKRKPPTPSRAGILEMIPEVDRQLKEFSKALKDSVVTLEPVPRLETMDDYEGLFWELDVIDNHVVRVRNLAALGLQVIDMADELVPDDKAVEAVANDFDKTVDLLDDVLKDLDERRFEFRLDRMELAKTILEKEDGYMVKLQAAFAGQQDAAAFKEMFKWSKDREEPYEFSRERLAGTQLQSRVESLSEEIEGLSDSHKEQSIRFFVGINWWLRGRYGRSPVGHPLLKDPRVVEDDRWLFPLLVPTNLGQPPFRLERNPKWSHGNDETPYVRKPTDGKYIPPLVRRHHYIWMFEYRRSGQVASQTLDAKKLATVGQGNSYPSPLASVPSSTGGPVRRPNGGAPATGGMILSVRPTGTSSGYSRAPRMMVPVRTYAASPSFSLGRLGYRPPTPRRRGLSSNRYVNEQAEHARLNPRRRSKYSKGNGGDYIELFRNSISKNDSRMIKRLIGYWEYLNALRNLEPLLKDLSPQQKSEIDAYLKARDQFAMNVRDANGIDDEQRGLEWLTAIAKVELGAMLAAFTEMNQPWALIPPQSHDEQAFRRLMINGVGQHYTALQNDAVAKELLKSSNVTAVLAYNRRMSMLRAMLSVLSVTQQHLAATEIQQLQRAAVELEKFSRGLTAYLNDYLTPRARSKLGTQTIPSLTGGWGFGAGNAAASSQRANPSVRRN